MLKEEEVAPKKTLEFIVGPKMLLRVESAAGVLMRMKYDVTESCLV